MTGIEPTIVFFDVLLKNILIVLTFIEPNLKFAELNDSNSHLRTLRSQADGSFSHCDTFGLDPVASMSELMRY